MLTGRKPFAAGDLATLFHQIRHEDPQPLGNGTPPELAAVVMKALSKSREMRYQSCQDVIAELNTVRQQYALESRLVAVGGPETSGLAADAQHVAQVETATPPISLAGHRPATRSTLCRFAVFQRRRHRVARGATVDATPRGIESPRRFRVRSSVWGARRRGCGPGAPGCGRGRCAQADCVRGDEVVKETSLWSRCPDRAEAGNDPSSRTRRRACRGSTPRFAPGRAVLRRRLEEPQRCRDRRAENQGPGRTLARPARNDAILLSWC